MQEAPRGAILQRDKETYAIVTRTPMGVVSPEHLESIAAVVRKYNIPIVKITSGQRLALVGIKPEDVERVWSDLGIEPGPAVGACVHYVQACPGNTVCRMGLQDSLGLAGELENQYLGFEMPAKFKIGVSGCPMNCGEGPVRDFGVYGKRDGWTVLFGGNSGGRTRIADVIGENLSTEEVLALFRKSVEYYKENAKPRERASRFMERIGLEEFKRNVL